METVDALNPGPIVLRRDLRQQLGVASECGRCACCARDILRTTLSELSCCDDELAEAA